MEIKPSYYAVVPADVRYDKTLPANAKLLYAEISSLTNKEGYCWASNNYFADLYGVSKIAISNWISKLVKAGYLESEINKKDGNERKLYLLFANPIKENFNTLLKKTLIPIKENFNTTINNKYNNKTNINTFENTDEKENLKKREEVELNKVISEVIFAFKEINAAYSKWFQQKGQRDAVRTLIKTYSLERVLEVITWLPEVNKTPYMPTITSPYELEAKWVALESAMFKKKNETKNRPKVIFS